MFRIAKQLKISQLIHECETIEELCLWFRVIADQIGIKKSQTVLSSAFLKSKSLFNDQIIDQLLASGPIQLYPDDPFALKASHTNSERKISKPNETRLNLDTLPNGVFLHISFYLTIKSNLNLSMTSHSFHKQIQNGQCLGIISRQCHNIIVLDTQILDIITQNNCIMECMHNIRQIDIKTAKNDSYPGVGCVNCPLYRLITKISFINYDLSWFKTIFSNMTRIFVSNSYPCALQHIPVSWIFENKNGTLEPIQILGAGAGNMKGRLTRITTLIIERFAQRMNDYVNSNPDTKLRKIQRIWHCRRSCDTMKIFSSFGKSWTGLILDWPRIWDDKCRFDELDAFFKVFHKNLKWFEIHIDDYKMENSNITSQLFKKSNDNKQFYNDLQKNESQLPFNQFLQKYKCKNKRLPKIKTFVVDFDDHVAFEESVLYKLFHHDKIMKLLNIQQSSQSLRFTLYMFDDEIIKHKMNIKNASQLVISRLDKLKRFGCTLDVKIAMNQEKLEEFFHLANEFLLQMVVKPRAETVSLVLITEGWKYVKNFEYTIRIENKDELLYKNRNILMIKISSIVDQCIEAAKKIWSQDTNNLVKIQQYFQFERDYSM